MIQHGSSGATRGRVLVVDDDAALSEMLGIVLRGEGFEPVFCADGAEARRFNRLLIDAGMIKGL